LEKPQVKGATSKKGESLPKRIYSMIASPSPIVVAGALIIAAVYPLSLSGNAKLSVGIYLVYFMWIALAESWNLVGGYGGLLNLGLVAFFILGGVVASTAMTAGENFYVATIVAGLVGSILAIALIPTFRLRSDYFAIATLVIPIILKPVVEYFAHQRSSFTFPASDVIPPVQLYYVGIAISAICIFGTYFMMRSRIGVGLRALGDDETASASLGISTLYYKTIALAISGFIAAVAGAYFLELIGSVSTSSFLNFNYSLFPIFMVIIGGAGTFEGPIIGAIIFSLVDYTSTNFFKNSNLDVLFFSLVIIAVAVLLPKGIMHTIKKYVVPLFHRSWPKTQGS
jgi:branched-chain amino acid transport system permease protein